MQKTKWFLVLTALLTGAAVFANGVDRENKSIQPEVPPTPDQALERYTTNLTRNAVMNPQGQSPFMGRVDDQIRLITILSQKGTQVVYLIGPAGAGKTALVEAVAGELKGVEVVQLDLGALQAGSPYKNETETRIKALVTKLVESKGQFILFVDEFHAIMKIDGMADMLKPPMARGQISVVAATTYDEYREYVEKDPALTSRAQKMEMAPMTKEEALQMLRSRKASLTQKYGLVVLDATLKQAVDLAARFYATEPLSRKALQLVDETMSRISTQAKYGAQTKRVLDDRLKTLKNEKGSLEADVQFLKDADKEAAQKRINELNSQISNTEENIRIEEKGGTPSSVTLDMARREMFLKEGQLAELKKHPDASSRKLSAQIMSLEVEIKRLREVTIPDLRAKWEKESQERGKDKPISVDDIRLTVSADRRIPMDGIGSSAHEVVARLRNLWLKDLFGQDHIMEQLAKKVQTRLLGLEPNMEKPLTMMWNGATGTGKTEAAKIVGNSLLFDSAAVIRESMGQHQTEMSIGTLFGSGRGYVDSDKGGTLTEKVRQRPFSVLLLDEYEKATRQMDSVMLEILDKGGMRDGAGRWVDFSNVIIILTTNLTSEWVFERNVLSVAEIEEKYGFREGELARLSAADMDREVTNRILQSRFSKEFIARFDIKANFNPIDMTMARELSAKEFRKQAEALMERRGVKLSYSQAAIDALAQLVINAPEGGREAANSRKNIITETILLEAFAAKNNIQRGQELAIEFVPDANNLGGEFKVSRDGQVLSQTKVINPVRVAPAASNGTAASGKNATELQRMMERAQGSQEAARGSTPGLIDAKGQPIKPIIETGRARGK
jgi:ATP-dependent Clp protease ATP-binding subunit ClpB